MNIFSCVQKSKQENNIEDSVRDTIVRVGDTTMSAADFRALHNKWKSKQAEWESSQEEKRKQFKENERIDSLRLDKVLKETIIVAKNNLKNGSFELEYKTIPDDSSFSITVQLSYGNIFSNSHRHLIIRRIVPWGACIDVFLYENYNFKSVIDQFAGWIYIGDSIRDVNGDNQLDFLVHSYAANGCCKRDAYDVYLFQSLIGIFSSSYEFINATFSPKEGIIRGVEYGFSGEAPLYKYKWNGLQVDTIEYIYHLVSKMGSFIKTMNETYKPTEKEGVILKSVPIEYHTIESYGWFDPY